MTTHTTQIEMIKHDDEQGLEDFFYPKEIPCIDCAELDEKKEIKVNGHMQRAKGDNYYLFKYRCNKKGCHRAKEPIYGKQRTCEFDWDGEDNIYPKRDESIGGTSDCQSGKRIHFRFKDNVLEWLKVEKISHAKKVKVDDTQDLEVDCD